MKQKNADIPGNDNTREDENTSEGYYSASEDIYHKSRELADLNPEDITEQKAANQDEKSGVNNEKDFYDDETGSDLDVPGSELDDKDEKIGSEDEENNYYSIGGDEHNNLDEND